MNVWSHWGLIGHKTSEYLQCCLYLPLERPVVVVCSLMLLQGLLAIEKFLAVVDGAFEKHFICLIYF